MNHPTTYRTSGWPTTPAVSPMDPLFSKVLIDSRIARPPAAKGRRPRQWLRRRFRRPLAAAMHRWADRLEAPAPLPAPCR
jgi:hypothetical protein